MSRRKDRLDSFQRFEQHRRVIHVCDFTLITWARNRKNHKLVQMRLKRTMRGLLVDLQKEVTILLDLDSRVKEAIPQWIWDGLTDLDPLKEGKKYMSLVMNIQSEVFGRCIPGAIDQIESIEDVIDKIFGLEMKTFGISMIQSQ